MGLGDVISGILPETFSCLFGNAIRLFQQDTVNLSDDMSFGRGRMFRQFGVKCGDDGVGELFKLLVLVSLESLLRCSNGLIVCVSVDMLVRW